MSQKRLRCVGSTASRFTFRGWRADEVSGASAPCGNARPAMGDKPRGLRIRSVEWYSVTMSNLAQSEMDVAAFLLWADGRDGRWELRDGQPVLMAPERALHALVKLSAQIALREGVRRPGLLCRVFPGGMTVRM